MRSRLQRAWTETDGVLSFEWVLLLTLLVLGIVAGLAAARDAIISELGDASRAMLALDHSYTIDYPLELAVSLNGEGAEVIGKAARSEFTDSFNYTDCGRADAPAGQ